MTSSTDPPASVFVEFIKAHDDKQPMTVYCTHCPEWSASGTAAETKLAAEQHWLDEHPEICKKPRKVRSRRVFSQALTAERRDEIEEERRQRMRSLGIG